jgi:DNA repair exonuclease SbcCD nuclease subunit
VTLILAVNDIHATRRPPSSCTDSYWPDLLNLLYQTADVARERDVRAVAWAGDVFHHKAPSRTDHGLVQDLIDVVRAYPCPLYVVPGNHDIQHDRLDSIDVTQPLGVLFKAGALRLEGWADGNLPLYGVPWQQEWSQERVRACLADFRERVFGQSLVVTHAPIYPPGREPQYDGAEYTPARWWADAVDDGPFEHGLAYGHIHEPHGVFAADGSGLRFCNFGALSRGSLDEYNLNREVGCALWSTDGGFEFVPLKARPAGEVFRLRQHEEAATARHRLDGFLSGVSETVLDVLSTEKVLAYVRTLDVGRAVENLAEELLMRQGEAK